MVSTIRAVPEVMVPTNRHFHWDATAGDNTDRSGDAQVRVIRTATSNGTRQRAATTLTGGAPRSSNYSDVTPSVM